MKAFVIDEKTAATPIGELLRQVSEGVLTLVSADGRPVGWIGPPLEPPAPPTPEDFAEIRRLSQSEPEEDLTTEELLRRLRARTDSR